MARDPMRPTSVSSFMVRLFLVMGIAMSVLGALLLSVTPVLLIVGLSWTAVALGLGTLFWWMRRRVDRREALKHEGAPGKATVLGAERTHTRIGNPGAYVYKMHLRIEAEGMEPYELEKRLLPKVGSSGLEAGREWPVYVDRTDRDNIMVDWDALLASGNTVTIGPGLTISSQGQLDVRQTPDAGRVVLDVLRGRGITIRGAPAPAGDEQTTPAARAPEPAANERTVGDRMVELHRLKDAGLISAEEFEQQRARLIDSI